MDSADGRAYLNLAAFEPRSRVDGPGLRATIWVQGCSVKCPGCINAEFIPNRPNMQVPLADLANYLIDDREIEGVSFSGGEPFDQALNLAILCEMIRSRRPELTYFAYSGYDLAILVQREEEGVHRLLKQLDILVAGPFLLAQRGNFKWRGSANKQIHFLSPRYSPEVLTADDPRLQIRFNGDGTGTVQGFGLNAKYMKKLKNILAKKGIELAIK